MQKFSSFGRKKKQTKIRHRMVMLRGLQLFLQRKNKNHCTYYASQSQDNGVLEDLFAVCQEKWVALDTANLVTFFFTRRAKLAQNLS